MLMMMRWWLLVLLIIPNVISEYQDGLISLVPMPKYVSMGEPSDQVALSPTSKIVYSATVLHDAATTLSDDLHDIFGLELTVVQGAEFGRNDIMLELQAPSKSQHASTSQTPTPAPTTRCYGDIQNTKFNNTNYADSDGPRTAMDAGDCCNICSKTANCEHWSFQIDPTVSGKICHWATLTYCCWMHSPGSAGNSSAAKETGWTSGTIPPPPPPPAMPNTLPPAAPKGWPNSSYSVSSQSTIGVVIKSETEAGIQSGVVTMLQLLAANKNSTGHISVPACTIRDAPFREWRGIQLDLHGTPYHSIELLKLYIRLARWYKLNVLTFNLGPSIWMSPTMNSTSMMNASWRAGVNPIGKRCYNNCVFYSFEEMTDLIQYGKAHGVRLVPSTGMMPGDSEVVRTLNASMLPPDSGYKFHDWMDEVDGKGPSTYNGSQTGPAADRYWEFIGVTIERVYSMFAAGWPDGVLPTWHVGAVEGEGGMDGKMLRKLYDKIQNAAIKTHGPNVDPVVVGMYSGLDANDPAIEDVKSNLAIHWYTGTFSQSTLDEYVLAGWQVVDITWVPLYIARVPYYTPKQVFDYFNLFWASANDGTCWTGNENLTSNCEQYWMKGRESQTLGAIMTTWTAPQPDELGLVRMRSAALAEHLWNYFPFPYPSSGKGSYDDDLGPRSVLTDKVLDKMIGTLIKNYKCNEESLQCEKMPTFPNGSSWTNGTDYEPDCGGVCCGRPCPGPPNWTVYGGRLWATSKSYSPNFMMNGKLGIAAADEICVAEAISLGLIQSDAPLHETARYRALLSDEAGCNGQPCRRASKTPGVGDGQIDWIIAPNAAYYKLDNVTLVTWSNSSAMLGIANHTKVGYDNQASSFGPGWVTLPNRTCNSWRWAVGMSDGPYGIAVGSQGWELQGFQATAGVDVGLPCKSHDFICVEMAQL